MELRLRTEITVEPKPGLLDYGHPVMLLGSCFSDNIGRRLSQRGFKTVFNPLGPVYNPPAMKHQAGMIASGNDPDVNDFFFHQGLWRHFMAHTLLGRPTTEEAAAAMTDALGQIRRLLSPETLLCLTLGTARVFELKESHRPVANCHKLPANLFTRRMIDADEAAEAIDATIDALRPSHTILTLSPIRHLADGLDGNSLSKAILRVAIDKVVSSRSDVTYFPAYEAIVDDLRDYRFYSSDMTHPTEQAADYVYGLFEEAFADDTTREKARTALKAALRAAHRPLIPTSQQ